MIRVGTTVRTQYGVADVVEIELNGKSVDEVEGADCVIHMSNGHWCYADDVLEVLHHQARSI